MLPYPKVLYFLLNVSNLFIAVKFYICIAFDLLFVKIFFIRKEPAKVKAR